jgi:hypothetical protein
VLLAYAAAVWVTTAAFARWYEEPALARQFGAQYQAYRRAVPAWRPRTRPWKQGLLAALQSRARRAPARQHRPSPYMREPDDATCRTRVPCNQAGYARALSPVGSHAV